MSKNCYPLWLLNENHCQIFMEVSQLDTGDLEMKLFAVGFREKPSIFSSRAISKTSINCHGVKEEFICEYLNL